MLTTLPVSLAIMSTSCQNDMAEEYIDTNNTTVTLLDVNADTTTSIIAGSLEQVLIQTTALDNSDFSLLLKIKEDEKLARDVYDILYQTWGRRPFINISKAESTHLNAVIRLLSYNGSSDTIIAQAGTFIDSKIQTLYNELVIKGKSSLINAYTVGALIEEFDILDLQESISKTTNENLILVFDNLMRGSRNHLRAYNRQLKLLKVTYTPVYISQKEFDEITNTPVETGSFYQNNNSGSGSCFY